MATYTRDEYRSKFLDPVVRVTRRVEILESNGNTLWSGAGSDSRLVNGAVSIDYSRDERRSLDLELANFDNALASQSRGFWYDKILRVYRGVEFTDADGIQNYEVPLGKFLIDRISQARFPNTVKITARDQTKKCMLSKFTTNTSFAKNTNIKTIIDALAANCGIFDRVIPPTNETLGSDTVFERGASRWEAMKQIATAYSYELFFDAAGYLIMRKFLDPTTSPISHTFATGPVIGNLINWEKSSNDTRIFNIVSVSGVTDSQVAIRADAINNALGSPTAVDEIGPRVLTFDLSIISNEAQAQELADSLLRVNALEEYEINFSSLVTPWLEAGEIVRFVDPDPAPGEPDRFLLTSFTVPLGLGEMGAVGRRVTIAG